MSKEGTKLFGVGWSDYNGKAMVSNRYWIPKPVIYNSYDYDYDYDDYSWYDTKKANRFSKKKSDKRYKSYIDYLLEEVV